LRNDRGRPYKAVAKLLLLLVVLASLRCHLPVSAEAEYNRISTLFLNGRLADSEASAAKLADRFRVADPQWAVKFSILEAESASWRGMNQEAIDALSGLRIRPGNSELAVRRLSILGSSYAHQHQFDEAEQSLSQAQALCSDSGPTSCGEMLRARASVDVERGKYQDADRLYLQSLSFARRFGQRWDEAVALMNLGSDSLNEEHFGDAIDLLRDASRIATQLEAGDVLVNTIGNLGWAYYKLGDSERALSLLQEAESRAVVLGDPDDAIAWLTDLGHVYEYSGNMTLAVEAHRQALEFSKSINSKEDIITALEDLAHVSVQASKFDEASEYIDQALPLIRRNNNRLDALDIMLTQGDIAGANRDDARAQEIYRAVEKDVESQTSMRITAEYKLARLYETEAKAAVADNAYKTALTTFEGARDQLNNEESKLPFLANASHIYDDYIRFLVEQRKTNEALMTADQSRARTLTQGLGVAMKQGSFHPATISPQSVARTAGATILFYWLGSKQSYLWAITQEKTALYTLPAEKEITPLLDRYRKVLLGTADPLKAGNADSTGQALYRMLVAPAAKLIRPDVPVMILADGPLSQLNFESLIVPAAEERPNAAQTPHYWIEDATLISAPSLAMLAKSGRRTAVRAGSVERGKLLLLGDPVSANENYPELAYAGQEITRIQRHFAASDEVVFKRQEATPGAYLGSDPRRFTYIHFVSHGVASRTAPLDSAIILSKPSIQSGGIADNQDSFKLYAREVMRHPIDARLVTISACYGSGIRAYAGEGLVGLSWAFLRAGAHNVIGALWEASDDSTARLMDGLYAGLHDGQSPESALRAAKLTLLHSQNNFHKPFYWAPFQIYTGL